uniref:Uncharacterized protein n=1 Tax=Sphaerodactylus townsendi TaxID=933632 RepID=A0ACB8FL24_9SAUR
MQSKAESLHPSKDCTVSLIDVKEISSSQILGPVQHSIPNETLCCCMTCPHVTQWHMDLCYGRRSRQGHTARLPCFFRYLSSLGLHILHLNYLKCSPKQKKKVMCESALGYSVPVMCGLDAS